MPDRRARTRRSVLDELDELQLRELVEILAGDMRRTYGALGKATRELAEAPAYRRRTRLARDLLVIDLDTERDKIGDTLSIWGFARGLPLHSVDERP